MPPHWAAPDPFAPKGYKHIPTRHFEHRHVGDWQLNMKSEQSLGLAPPDWSTSSKMDDIRPNGKALFDARFSGNAMGRARGGYAMVADARGMEATAGKLERAQNMDSNFFASDMADETTAAAASAEANKLGNNSHLGSFSSACGCPAASLPVALPTISRDHSSHYENTMRT